MTLFVDGIQLPQGNRATSRRKFTFYHQVSRKSWYSFDQPRKDDRLSQPWNHPVDLHTGPLDWESSILITRLYAQTSQIFDPLYACMYFNKSDVTKQQIPTFVRIPLAHLPTYVLYGCPLILHFYIIRPTLSLILNISKFNQYHIK